MHFLKYYTNILLASATLFLLPTTLEASGRHHQFRAGPDIYYRDYDEKGLTVPAKSHEFGWLYGFNIGYEYINADSLYAGADINTSWGKTVYDGSLINLITGDIKPYESRTHNFFFDAEGRLGYTFCYGNSTLLSPFGGIGYHFWHRGSAPDNPFGYDEDYSWGYFSAGIRAEHFLAKRFSVGLTLKAMLMFDGEMRSSDLHNVRFNLGNKLQYGVELPLTYFFECTDLFVNGLKLTPYFYNRDIGRSDTHLVEIPSIGLVQLVEPSSVTYVVGIRLELMHAF